MPDTPPPPSPASLQAKRARAKPRVFTRNPCTSEVQYTAEETHFMMAVDAWKKRTGRQFPTCSDYLQIAKECGYAKAVPGE